MLNSFFRAKRHILLVGVAAISFSSSAYITQAETVYQAMAHAYANSPQMALEREKLKLSDEGIISARAGKLPTLNGEISLQDRYSVNYTSGTGWLPGSNALGLTGTLSASYNLWDNGIADNRIAQAEIGRLAQQDAFTSQEQNFLLTIFTTYVDVLRDSALLNVQIKNFNVLSEQQKASEARFQVGEATATDVSLAKARKAAARSAIAGSKAQLDASRAVYQQYVGHKPVNIRQPKQMTKRLPRSLQAALNAAEANHPGLKSLKKAVLSAEKSVKIAAAGLLPSARAFGSASQSVALDGSNAQTALSIGANLTIPIFDGGVKSSAVRQEKIRLAQARLNLSVSRAQIAAGVKARWAGLKAARTSAGADESQIRASRAVLNGVRAEAEEGVRTSFDVLNSEQDLLSAKVQSIVSQRGVLVSQMQLLAAIGNLTAQKLGLN